MPLANELEAEVIQRVQSAMDRAYRALEKELRTTYLAYSLRAP